MRLRCHGLGTRERRRHRARAFFCLLIEKPLRLPAAPTGGKAGSRPHETTAPRRRKSSPILSSPLPRSAYRQRCYSAEQRSPLPPPSQQKRHAMEFSALRKGYLHQLLQRSCPEKNCRDPRRSVSPETRLYTRAARIRSLRASARS